MHLISYSQILGYSYEQFGIMIGWPLEAFEEKFIYGSAHFLKISVFTST